MKHVIIFVTILLVTFTAVANENLNLPQAGFDNLSSLEKWASSTWGGGSLETVSLGGKIVHYSRRCFTSGVPTTEITFFTKQNEKYIPFLTIPTQRRELRVRVNKEKELGELIYVEAWSSASKRYEHALTISKWMIPE